MVSAGVTPYWRRYLRYLVVGGVVGVITVALRELVALALGTDTPFTYALSIVIAYAIGIALSLVGQAAFTFGQRTPHGLGRVILFTVVAAGGAVLAVVLARLIRYGLDFDRLFGSAGPGFAFALAALVTSVVSYAVNERFVFAPAKRGDAARPWRGSMSQE